MMVNAFFDLDLAIAALRGIAQGVILFLLFIECYHFLFQRKYSVVYFLCRLILDIISDGFSSAIKQRKIQLKRYRETKNDIQIELDRITNFSDHYLSKTGVFQNPLPYPGEIGIFLPLQQTVTRLEHQYSILLKQKESLLVQKKEQAQKCISEEAQFQKKIGKIENDFPDIVQQLDQNLLLQQIVSLLGEKSLPFTKPVQKELLLELKNLCNQIETLRPKKKKWKHISLLDHEKKVYSILAIETNYNFVFKLYKSDLSRQKIKPDLKKLKNRKNVLNNQLQKFASLLSLVEKKKHLTGRRNNIHYRHNRIKNELQSVDQKILSLKNDIQNIHLQLESILSDDKYLLFLAQIKSKINTDIEYLYKRIDRIGNDRVNEIVETIQLLLDQLDKENSVVTEKNLYSIL